MPPFPSDPNSNHDESPPGANDPGDRCVRYLIGEMNPKESQRFERDLQRSPDLADELIRSSDLVLGLVTPGDSQPVSLPAAWTSLPATRTAHRWRWPMAVAVAVAVSLLFVLAVWRPDHTADEELRIAKAWVTLDVAEPDPNKSDLNPNLPQEDNGDVADSSRSQPPSPLNTDSNPPDRGDGTFDTEDGPPEWLLAAVSAELERDESPTQETEGERNDG